MMIVKIFRKFNEIPGINKYLEKIPVFAAPEYADYLKAVKKTSTIWFLGTNKSDEQFLLPFCTGKKLFFTEGHFLTSTIYLSEEINIIAEKEFLDSVMILIKKHKICDWIGQSPNWAVFQTFPTNAVFCPFGTYRVHLSNYSIEELYNNVNYHHKRLINKSIKNNVIIKSGFEVLNDCISVFKAATNAGNYTLPAENELRKMVEYLPNSIVIYVAYNNSVPVSSVLFFFSKYSFYSVYVGHSSASGGENHLLHWQAIKNAKIFGCNYFDFVGARVSQNLTPKLEGIQRYKKYFGCELDKGFLWKMTISKKKYLVYILLVKLVYILKRIEYKGDIIDQELRTIKNEEYNFNN